MVNGRRKRSMLIGLLIGILIAGGIVFANQYCKKKEEIKKEIIKLEAPVIYEEGVQEILFHLQEEGVKAVTYVEEDNITINNNDFNRSTKATAMGVAGDASVLFPGSNQLLNAEEGYALLGKKTAIDLFGSTKVAGRTVEIKGETFIVAGIAYGKKENICVYQLGVKKGIKIEKIAFSYNSTSEQGILRRKLNNIFL